MFGNAHILVTFADRLDAGTTFLMPFLALTVIKNAWHDSGRLNSECSD